jgi:hypothetical protein
MWDLGDKPVRMKAAEKARELSWLVLGFRSISIQHGLSEPKFGYPDVTFPVATTFSVLPNESKFWSPSRNTLVDEPCSLVGVALSVTDDCPLTVFVPSVPVKLKSQLASWITAVPFTVRQV